MKKVDIAMTAVLRPAIMEGTLKTIVRRVVDTQERFRLIVNIDPVGQNVDPQDVVRVCKRYFNEVIYNIPSEPSFPKAVKWIWSKADSPFVFHWEDDVEILRPVNIVHMIKTLQKHQDVAALRLFSKKAPKKNVMYAFRSHWDYRGDNLWVARDWKAQFGLNPNLIRQAFVKEAWPRMVDDFNPEKQFRDSQKYMRPLIKKWKYGIYAVPGSTRIIDGRKGQRWKDKIGMDKPKGRTFLEWVEKR